MATVISELTEHWYCNSRMQISPSMLSTVEPSKIFILPLRKCPSMLTMGVTMLQDMSVTVWLALSTIYCTTCTRKCWAILHTAWTCHHVTSMCLALSKSTKGLHIHVRQRCQDSNGRVLPAPAQAALFFWGGGGWLVQEWDTCFNVHGSLFNGPRTICEWVSSKKASYIHYGHHLEYSSILNLLNLEMWLLHTVTGAITLNPAYYIETLQLTTLHPQTISITA
jgi:hypothetical protein